MSRGADSSAPAATSGALRQRLIPGLVGLSVHTDCVYQHIMHERVAQIAADGRRVSRLKALLCSLDFAELVDHTRAQRWELAEQQIAVAAAALCAGGADFIVICANTGYALTARTKTQVALPILDIALPVCRAIRAAGLQSPGLLSTLKTEAAGVYRTQARAHGLSLIAPSPSLADKVQKLILEELVSGHVSEAGVEVLRSAASWFAGQGADCVILGCTDLTHLVEGVNAAGGTDVPLFDSTRLHAEAAAELAMSGRPAAE